MNKFFMPEIENEEDARNEWDLLNKSINGKEANFYKTGINSIRFKHNGKSLMERVGEPDATYGNLVIAIIESASSYNVVTVDLRDYSKATLQIAKSLNVRVDYFAS